ncbi:MAG: polyribonucleotide nucleotidyltransferase [Candidatus Jacksonbacteria bacterium]|jgi:polyribonucleotide nucleotidyltransferase|nr:polyribonucleotide nucleotidyltransferase [Candidatus Jacksonbacteria bacterium]MBT6034437.1 polyribonucleotide nucleotidyltransferase [Candidatus Jacksonbacteria bacterium]MBT6300924.1 polyribonucleotide nucleotidyltransferase [Candidatus Jacksonbacteria bacterium]MBT6757326.1 polyribonucleotide nucleotidyltransferase [Candidatus Jacksonbacteria bacterium]MBT6954906.1 polyribonucleotide nucleotidyltransferase [Candidatus Jacksonbacteria bacterium]
MPNVKTFKAQIDSNELSIESGRFALQANASLTMKLGDTVVLATVVMSKNLRDGIDYFPLMVDYEEKFYAAGKIKGSRFIKREGRPSDEAVLSGRLIDRAIRPLFPEEMKNDVQVILSVLSQDDKNDADIVALNAAAAVLYVSDVPWDGPIAGVRVGRVDGELVLNPTYEQREKSDLDLVVAGTKENVLMIEAGANEITEDDVFAAIQFAQKHIGDVTALLEDAKQGIGKEKMALEDLVVKSSSEESEDSAEDKDALSIADEFIRKNIDEHLFTGPMKSKGERKEAIDSLKAKLEEFLLEKQIGKEKRKKAADLVWDIAEERVTQAILTEDKRVDGRSLTQIRDLSAEVGFLPRAHGSGVFNRGETQVLSAVTLGAPSDQQIVDTMEGEYKKRYMHHYNFLPYSVGEVSPMRGAGRREIGHGALAEKALDPVLPESAEFPYTIRVVSEVLGSNGSSSMGSICGSTLSLMDAGVPLKKPVGGIAMGLASDTNGNWKVLTDLQDLEDGKGGMDFKLAGTKDGITAIQLDTKTKGLSEEIVKKTLEQGKVARLEVLDVISGAIAEHRDKLSEFAPRIHTLKVNPDKIRDIIGPSGKTINGIIDETGVDIDIEQDGTVLITGTYANDIDGAIATVEGLTAEAEVGKTYKGSVTRVESFGVFVEVLPKQDGLVHISKLGSVQPTDMKIGDPLEVKVSEIDDLGRINLEIPGVESRSGQNDSRSGGPRGSGGSNSRGPRRGNNSDGR